MTPVGQIWMKGVLPVLGGSTVTMGKLRTVSIDDNGNAVLVQHGLEILLGALLCVKSRAIGQGRLASHGGSRQRPVLLGPVDPGGGVSWVAHTARGRAPTLRA